MTAYKLKADVVRDAARARGDTTIKDIANHTGIHYIDLVAQLNGRRTTGLHSAMRISNWLDLTVNQIVVEVEEPNTEDDEPEPVAA